jgi:hypothetical protein
MRRDYANMPVLEWNPAMDLQKAELQILHQEPVILQMPDSIDLNLDAREYGCQVQEDTGILYDCDGGRALHQLAERNRLPSLEVIAEACDESRSQVDIDPAHKRLIVHD